MDGLGKCGKVNGAQVDTLLGVGLEKGESVQMKLHYPVPICLILHEQGEFAANLFKVFKDQVTLSLC